MGTQVQPVAGGTVTGKYALWENIGDAGYNVLNRGRIGFPRYHRDRDTVAAVGELVRAHSRDALSATQHR